MKDAILLELAKRWELEAMSVPDIPPAPLVPGSAQDIQREVMMAKVQVRRECAGDIRLLIDVLGGSDA